MPLTIAVSDHEDMGTYEEACQYLQRCLEVSGAGDSHVRKAYALLVNALHRVGQSDRAWEVCLQGRQQFPNDPELAFRAGIMAHERGSHAESERAYLTALENKDSRHFSSLDLGVYGIKARHNLALLYLDMKKPDDAEVQCRRGIQDQGDCAILGNLA